MSRRNQKGSAIMDMALAIVVLTTVMAGLITLMNSMKRKSEINQEKYLVYSVEKAIEDTFKNVINTYSKYCNQLSGTETGTNWGWESTACQETSPLPYIAQKSNGISYIKYDIDFGSIGQDGVSLKTTIRSAFKDCFLAEDTSSSIGFICGYANGGIVDLYYIDSTGGNSDRFHIPGNFLKEKETPNIVIVYERDRGLSSHRFVKYRFTLQHIYESLRACNVRKFEKIEDTFKSYYNRRLSQEMSNTYPNGLSSADDALVPWYWQLFASDSSGVNEVCQFDISSGNCINFNSNVWNDGNNINVEGAVWDRVIKNLFDNDYTYDVDCFGNAIRLIPILNGCNDSDWNNCQIIDSFNTPPPAPQDNYSSVSRVLPPFKMGLHTRECSDSTQPEYCKHLIVY